MTVTDNNHTECAVNNEFERIFDALVEKYTPAVKAAARTRLKDPSDIDDCVSEVFSELWRMRDRLHDKNIAALLCMMAKRRAIDICRRNMRTSTEAFENMAESADSFSLEGDYEEKESREELIAAIKSLGEPDATLIIGRYYFGESSAGLGRRLGLSESTVNVRMHRAIKKLRKILEKGGNGK